MAQESGEREGTEESRGWWGRKVLREIWVLQGHRDLLALRAPVECPFKGRRGRLGREERRAKSAGRDFRVFLDLLGPWDETGHLDRGDFLEKLDHRDSKDQQDQLEPPGLQDLQDLKDRQGQWATWDHLVLLAIRVRRVNGVTCSPSLQSVRSLIRSASS